MMPFLKSLWTRRWIRRCAWTFATLFTAIILFHAWVNWRGARHWRDTLAMLEHEGEQLDFRALLPEPIPDEQNFCAIDALRGFSPTEGKPMPIESLALPEGRDREMRRQRPQFASGASLGQRVDLKAWADWLREDGSFPMPAPSGDAARDVVAGLSKHDALVRELAAGLGRPHAQWTPAWKSRPLTHPLLSQPLPRYGVLRAVWQSLALRSIAAARAGDAAKAHEALEILLRMDRATLDEPFLIGLLVAAAHTESTISVVWELCDAHVGSAEDFRRIERALAELDFTKAALQGWRGEMAAGVDALMFVKESRTPDFISFVIDKDGHGKPGAGAAFTMWSLPAGFFDANAAVLAEHELAYLIRPLREQGWLATIASAAEFETKLKQTKPRVFMRPSHLAAVLLAPAAVTATRRVAYTQCLVNQAIIACALERHRIEHGAYPDSLDALAPLPLDVATGQPMRYRKVGDRYALWSTGFDGKDDDAKRGEGPRFLDGYRGDWVWDFPVKP
jgi:hypothetical protein